MKFKMKPRHIRPRLHDLYKLCTLFFLRNGEQHGRPDHQEYYSSHIPLVFAKVSCTIGAMTLTALKSGISPEKSRISVEIAPQKV